MDAQHTKDNPLAFYIQGTEMGELFQVDRRIQVRYQHMYKDMPEEWRMPASSGAAAEGGAESETIAHYFANMLPEGHAIEALRATYGLRRSDLLGALSHLGYDTAGAISFGDILASRFCHRKIEYGELAERLSDNDPASLIIWDGVNRLSVAGVQPKLNVGVMAGEIFLAGTDEGSHILKFSQNGDHRLILTELYCMKLAEKAGLDVPEVLYKRIGEHPALLVRRFDRSLGDGYIHKNHIIDGCQLLNLPADYKYEQCYGHEKDVAHIREGASLPALFKSVEAAYWPDEAKQQLLDWTVFNLIIGNGDAHGKNISFHITSKGFAPAPFYDLVSTGFWAGDNNLAMAIDDNFDLNSITAYDLLSMAETVGIEPKRMKRSLERMLDNIEYAIESTDISNVSERARELQHEIKPYLKSRVEYYREQVQEFYFVERSLL